MNKEFDWWQKPRKVSVVVDNPSWVVPFCEELVEILNGAGDQAVLCKNHSDVQKGDIAFYIGCVHLTPNLVLARNRRNLVAHASDLPKGRGFSPMTWQIIEGRNKIPLCLIDAVEEVDTGPIILKKIIQFQGHELIDELRDKLGQAQVELAMQFLEAEVPLEGKAQVDGGSVYSRRAACDSRLDPELTLSEQFNLLRTIDNENYPAFFDFRGHRYQLTIKKTDPEAS